MKKKILTSCCIAILLMFNAIGRSPDQMALIPKPRSLQLEKTTMKLEQVFRIFDNSSSGHDYAQFINTGCLRGMDYKCINSSYEKSEIIVRKSGRTDVRERYTLRINQPIFFPAMGPGLRLCISSI